MELQRKPLVLSYKGGQWTGIMRCAAAKARHTCVDKLYACQQLMAQLQLDGAVSACGVVLHNEDFFHLLMPPPLLLLLRVFRLRA